MTENKKELATKEAPAFDFASFDKLAQNQESGTEMPVRHPVTGVATPMVMIVGSYESEQTAVINRAIVERRAREGRRSMTPDELDEENLEVQISAVRGWSNCRLDGEDLEFTHDNLRRFLLRFKFVREQIDAHAGSRAAFLKS